MTQPTAVLSICRFSRVHFLSKKKKVESKQISPRSVNWAVSVLKPISFPLSGVFYRSRCWGFMNAMAQSWAQDTTSWKSPVTSGLDSLSTPLLKCSVRLEAGRGDLDVTLRGEHSADRVDLYQLLRQWVWGMELLLLLLQIHSPPTHRSEMLAVPGSFSVAFTAQLDSHGYRQLFRF